MTQIIFFLLFLLPFVVFPFGNSQFEVPKVIVAELLIILLFVFCIFSKKEIVWDKKYWVYAAIFVVSLYDLFFHFTSFSFFGNGFRLQGTLLLWLLLLFSFLSSQISFKLPSSKFFFFLVLVELIFSLFITGEGNRAIGTLGEPNSLAAFYIGMFPFLLYSSSKEKIPYRFLGTLCIAIGILFSASRAGMVALIILIIFYGLQKLGKLSLPKAVWVTMFLIVGSYFLPLFEKEHVYENRTHIWQTSFLAGTNNSFLGAGFGNLQRELNSASVLLGNTLQARILDSSHNIFLDWWVQGGIVGIGLLIYIVVRALFKFSLQNKARECMVLLGLLVVLSFNPMSVSILVLFWWVIGQSFQSSKKASNI